MSNAGSKLSGAVVVITGASSGLGREAAIQFARLGAYVVAAARRRHDLEETARLCQLAGGRALAVVTDVTRETEVQALCVAALAAWGRVDVWVNNAGVTLFARLDEGTLEEHRRVIDVNLFGALLCARAVIPIFKSQRRGVMINVGSVLGEVGQPYVPSYVISKFALRGLSEALRTEFAEHKDIHVCTLLPYSIDTPHFQSGANEMGQRARAIPPIQSPEKVAQRLVQLAIRPQREAHVPKIIALGLAVRWLFPRTTERLLRRALTRWHFDMQAQDPTTGNLYAPVERHQATIHGDRRPQLSTTSFAVWTLRELVRMGRPGARVNRSANERAQPEVGHG
jgi:NAD(P)-dependent dehydrogenase (short-subunit alcohol dehydrogenase family)